MVPKYLLARDRVIGRWKHFLPLLDQYVPHTLEYDTVSPKCLHPYALLKLLLAFEEMEMLTRLDCYTHEPGSTYHMEPRSWYN